MSGETMLGVLPENVVPLEPGETSATDDKHMRNRKEGGLLCGAVDGSPVARAWVNVTCVDCLEKRSKTTETTTEKKPKTKAKKEKKEAPKVERIPVEVELPQLIGQMVNFSLFYFQRPPAPVEPLHMFSVNAVSALDHYGLLEHAEHPLAGVILSGAILVYAIKDMPIIEDAAALHEAHGVPYGGEA